jgi:hypothetical protein
MLKLWGRPTSLNVQKVLWCLAELDLAYERIDAGMAFGKNDTPEYLAMNPNGRVPTLVDGDYVLWESNSIMRYLNLAYGKGSAIYPQDAKARAAVDSGLRALLLALGGVSLLVGGIAVLATAGAVVAGVLLNGNDTRLPSTTEVGPRQGSTSATPGPNPAPTRTASGVMSGAPQ